MDEKKDERFEKWLSEHTSADFAPNTDSEDSTISDDTILDNSDDLVEEYSYNEDNTSTILEEIPERTFLLNDYYFEDSNKNDNETPDFSVYTPLVSDSTEHKENEPFRRKVRDTQYVVSDGEEDELSSNTGRDFLDMNSFSIPELVTENKAQASKNASKSARRERKLEKRRNKQKRKKNRWLFRVTWIVFVAMLGIYAGSYLSKGASDVFAMNRSVNATVDITIPEEADLDEVINILSEANVIDQPEFFKLYCKATHTDQFGRGEFQIPTNMDYEEIINFLLADQNRVDVVTIMFYEGINSMEVAQLLDENDVAKYDDVIKALNSDLFDRYDNIAMIDPDPKRYYKIEGYLFPDTYNFYKGEGAEEALSKLIYNGQKKIMTKETDEILTERGMTYDELIILASLVQGEAANAAEMPKIASVILNRLKDGYLYDIYHLELDSTIYYPYRTKEDLPDNMKDYVSEYDTYEIRGMPVGAICNPGMSAVNAVLHPEETNYYFFLHGPDGTTYFAETLEEHIENMRESGLLAEDEEDGSEENESEEEW